MTELSMLTVRELERLKALTKLPDAEVERSARAGDVIAAIEFEARWEISRMLWLKYRIGPPSPDEFPLSTWLGAVRTAWQRGPAPRTQTHSTYLAGRRRA